MRNIIPVLSVLLLSASPAAAQFECVRSLPADKNEQLVERVQSTYRQVSDLRADFTQQSYFLGLNKRVKSSGKVFFKKPGMMDWRYGEPEPQRFVADGRTLWFHQPELNQVTIGTFENSFNSALPVSFLLGVGSLRENFTVEQACRGEQGIILKLAPRKPDPALDDFLLLVDPDRYIPTGAKVIDVAGNETEITFSDVNTEEELEEGKFTYVIPRGVDIIDQRTAKQ